MKEIKQLNKTTKLTWLNFLLQQSAIKQG